MDEKTQEPGDPKRRNDRRAPNVRRPQGFLAVAMVLSGLILIAFLLDRGGSAGRDVLVNYSEVVDLLRRDRLDSKTLEYVELEHVIRGDILRAPDEAGPKRFELRFGEVLANKFLDEVDQYNRGLPAGGRHRIYPRPVKSAAAAWGGLLSLLPWVIFAFLIYFFLIRGLRASGPGGNVLTFGKSRARLATKETTGIKFTDVAGIDEAKGEVREVVEFLKNPSRFQRLGGRIPRGIMLVGSPGTGKTLLARAIAGEAEVPFFSICGSDFVEMFVGVGASRVRDLFRQARESSPCIIFLDEIDAVGRKRGSGFAGGHDEREQTLNAILVEMDGFNPDEGIIVIASTNRPDVLDPALLRPGRFDREIVIDLPDLKGREEILRVHTKKVKLDPLVDLHRIARGTATFSGAELAALVNEAAIAASMRERTGIAQEDFEEARDKIRWGRQKLSRVMVEEDRRVTAYHEAGHALAAHLLPEAEPLHKVTIIPRGMALGATMQLPERDRYHMSRKQLLDHVTVFYAGRVAEEMACGDITAGARNDIERATDLVRRMVVEWGMSESLGPIHYGGPGPGAFGGEEGGAFLGAESRGRGFSEAIAERIDAEVRRIVDECYQRCERLLKKHRSELERIAEALMARETLSGEEVATLVEGGTLEAARPRPAAGGGALPLAAPGASAAFVTPGTGSSGSPPMPAPRSPGGTPVEIPRCSALRPDGGKNNPHGNDAAPPRPF